jgi:uncharacterized membrane protein YqjE
MTITDGARTAGAEELERRPTGELLGAISNDLVTLVRQEVELGKQELAEAFAARLVALTVGSMAGVLAIVALVFGALGASDALGYLIPLWAARLTVAGAMGMAMLFALPVVIKRARRPQMRPAETLRTTKEDFEWAKAHLKR